MQWKKTITMVEAHAEGEVGRIVTSGCLLYTSDAADE